MDWKGWVRTLLLLGAFGLGGCGEKPVVTVYPALHERPVTCMRLEVFLADRALESSIEKLYPFRDDCPVVLEVRHKENICCNSTQNVQQKNLSTFPRHFLRLELRLGLTPLYSYYIDLDHPADTDDAKAAFESLQENLKLSGS